MPNWKKVITSGSDASLNSLYVATDITASGDVSIGGAIYDNLGSAGTSGQILTSTGTGIDWIDSVTEAAQDLIVSGKNVSGTTIPKGMPLYFTESGVSGNVVGVMPADAGNPNRMPAGGVAGEQLTSGSEGNVYIYGYINGVDTSAFNSGDDVYVAVGGGYTNQKPTGSALIQKLGNVEKVDASNGSGVINGPSWYNDLPNWESGKVVVGRSDGQPVTSSVIHLDESNGRLGVGTSSPSTKLHVDGTARITGNTTILGDGFITNDSAYLQIYSYQPFLGLPSYSPYLELKRQEGSYIPNSSTAGEVKFSGVSQVSTYPPEDVVFGKIQVDVGTNAGLTHPSSLIIKTHDPLAFSPNVFAPESGLVERMRIAENGNIGIGTSSPLELLHVYSTSTSGTKLAIDNGGSGGARWLLESLPASVSAASFAISSGGTYKLFIDGSDNVGIGTSSPSTKLDVNGVITATGGTSTEWNSAYDDKINSATFNTGNGIVTLNQQDGGTVTVDLDGRYLTSETSHADVVVDGDFSSEGLMRRGSTAGTYSIVTDNSANWNTAYNDKINSAAFSTSTGVLTLTQQDAGTITVDLDGRYSTTDTTYSAGNGITLTGTVFSVAAGGGLTQDAGGLSHSDTSTQGSVNNSGGTVIQDVTLDTYGHVTALTSYNLDGRYYTETEVGNFFSGTTAITGYNKTNWDTAYSWGNHASAGYLTSFDITTQTDPKYLRSDTADTAAGTITFSSGIVNSTTYTANTTSTRDKIRVWNTSAYTIGMQSGVTFGALNDYAMTFQMNNDNDRGWWWGDESHTTSQGAMSLTTLGELTLAKSARIGWGESDTTAATSPLEVYGSGGTVVSVDGSSGRLFELTDSMSGSLFSVNDISGLPILEVFSDNSVNMGTYGSEELKVSTDLVEVDGNIILSSANNPTLLIGETATVSTSFVRMYNGSANGSRIEHLNGGSGNSLLDISAIESVGTENAYVRFNRYTNTTGASGIQIHRSNNTSEINTLLGGNTNSYLNRYDGNVGIGTGSPGSLLQVGDSVGTGNHVFTLRNQFNGIEFEANQNINCIGWNTDLVFQTRNSSGVINTNQLVLEPNGKVGIGTASPAHTLDVNGVITGTRIDTTGYVKAGVGSGGVSLTHNDGYGNANIAFNHVGGVPEQNGNAGRITVNTDESTNAYMQFQVGSAVTSGVAVPLGAELTLRPTSAVLGTRQLRLVGDGSVAYNVTTTDDTTSKSWLTNFTGVALSAILWKSGTNLQFGTTTAFDTTGYSGAYLEIDGTSGTTTAKRLDVNTSGQSYWFSTQYDSAGIAEGKNIFIGNGGASVTSGASTFNGSNITSLGVDALKDITTGSGNVAIGNGIMKNMTSGAQNTGLGTLALELNTTFFNTAVGYGALRHLGTGAGVNGNTAIGHEAGRLTNSGGNNTSGVESVFVGKDARPSGTSDTNTIVIGNAARGGGSNTITLGNSSITTLRCNTTTITSLSDARDKKYITPLLEGIEFVKKLKPVSFRWNQRDGGRIDTASCGFIAQDLLELQNQSEIAEHLDLVETSNPDRLETRPANLMPIIVQAIKDQQRQIEKLNETIEIQKKLINMILKNNGI